MRAFFYILLVCAAAFGADFITKTEYAKMLYSNPRGIGCDKCHGAKGQGTLISKFKRARSKNDKTLIDDELRAPRINNISYEAFANALNKPKGIMPSYFLTDEESEILYDYVISLDKNQTKGKKK